LVITLLLLASACTRSTNDQAHLSPTMPPLPASPYVGAPIVLIVMENKDYAAVVGSPAAPYLNNKLIPLGRLFTNYQGVSHPSLPNYLAMTSGSTWNKDGTDDIAAGEIVANNLFHQLTAAGISWDAYQEGMPAACFTGIEAGSSPGTYTLKHDPAMAYRNIASTGLCRNVVPYGHLGAVLPAFSFVTPDGCHDTHSCPLSVGDEWLKSEVPPLLGAGAEVIITFDEGRAGQTIMTLVIGPRIAPGKDGTRYDHYGLLAGLGRHFGLARLGKAGEAVPLPV
jgi:hypothetical protein